MVVLPLTYWGNIEHFAHLLQAGDEAVIDLGENYVKRSERNRTSILTSGGVMQLSVQLAHANRPRQAMRDMRIDYSKRWQHQHFVAMESAYRSSPYHMYYADRFTDLYNHRWEYLVDLNMATLFIAPLAIHGWEWIIIALVVLLLFGGKKIPELMRGLGKGVKSFKQGMKEVEEDVKEIKKDIQADPEK